MRRSRSLAPMVFMLFAVAGLSGAVESAGLHSIYFDYGSSALSAESQKTLERHAAWLKDHAEVLLEVQGWDDFYVGKGDGRLSVKRAEAVKEFLAKSGVEIDRLTIKDRGAAPWDPARKSDPRTFRRVDFLVLGKREARRSEPEASPSPVATTGAPAPSAGAASVSPSPQTAPSPPVGAVEPVPTESAPAREPVKVETPPKVEPAAAAEPAKPILPVEPPPKKEASPSPSAPPKEEKAAAPIAEAKPVPPAPEPAKVSPPPTQAEKPAPEPVVAAAPPRDTPAALPEPEPPREEKIEQAWMKWKPSNVGPKPRWGHGMVFDPANDRVILHGGTNGKLVFGDVWEFDLKNTRWSPIQPGGGTRDRSPTIPRFTIPRPNA